MDEDDAMVEGAAVATCDTCGHQHENEDGTCAVCDCTGPDAV